MAKEDMYMDDFKRREDMYEEDPTGRIINETYDEIERDRQAWINGEGELTQEELEALSDFEIPFWEEDAETLLHEIGIDTTFSLDGVAEDRLKRIFKRYDDGARYYDENDILIESDPLPSYVAGNKTEKEEFQRLGYLLGQTGEIGRYYILLPNIDFARSFWKGKFERALNDGDDSMLLDVRSDIEAYDPSMVESEIASIADSIYKDTPEEPEKPKTVN